MTKDDLIRREDAVKTIHRYKHRLEGSGQTYGFLLEEFENRIPSAEAEWIPCSERLPKHGDDILVTYSDGEVSIIRGARSKNWMKWEALENSNLILPIAWMPLPMPYREDGEA